MISPAVPGRVARLLTRLLRFVLGARRAGKRAQRQEKEAFRAAFIALLQKVVDSEAEAVTVVAGSGADADVTAAGRAWLEEFRAGIPIDVVDGGQPLYPYLVGVE
jgi:dihydroxyacetone kinase-like predicted kinase